MASKLPVVQEQFAKNLTGLAAFKFRITLIEMDSLLQEFLGRLWAYAEDKDYVPKKPGAETKAALKRMRETQEVR